jgi:hypothetical protein
MRRSLLAVALAALWSPLLASPERDHRAADRPVRVELESPEVIVPLELVKNRPVLDVTIEGKGPFPFVLDTGAGGTVIDRELAEELELPVTGETRVGDPISPQHSTARRVHIERFEIGGATFFGVTAASIGHAMFHQHLGARGILGMPLFADLLLTLDYGGGSVSIGRGELSATDCKECLSYNARPYGLFRVPITVGAVELEAELDSGSPAGVSLPNGYMDALPLEGKPVEVGRARTVNSEFIVHGAILDGEVRIGGHSLERPDLRFNALPFANIGNEVLCHFVITIDQKSRRIRLREVPTGQAAG